jgi:membrane protease YdiL (CAAX protease family)
MTDTRFTVQRLIYSTATLAIGMQLMLLYVTKTVEHRDESLTNIYPLVCLLSLLLLLGIIFSYGSIRSILAWEPNRISATTAVTLGLTAGILVAAFAGLSHNSDSIFQGLLFSRAQTLIGVFYLSVILLAVPLAGEVVFRGIIFRTLAERATVPAAFIASSLLFAYLYPLYNFNTRLLFGILASALFYWTKSLIAPMFASIALSCAFFASVFLRISR